MINPNRVGLVFATLLGGWHIVWSLLVSLGWAQPLLDFVFWLHMIRSIYVVKAFDPVAAGSLVIVTACFGYVIGYLGATTWRKLHPV
jgi:hypothetical protein